jgi:hypothetical protein
MPLILRVIWSFREMSSKRILTPFAMHSLNAKRPGLFPALCDVCFVHRRKEDELVWAGLRRRVPAIIYG